MALKRVDNVGIVVDDLGGTIDFLRELGLDLEEQATIEGEWARRVTGLAGSAHILGPFGKRLRFAALGLNGTRSGGKARGH